MSLPLAEVELVRHGTVLHARVRGDVDMSNAAELRSELRAKTPNDVLGLILDLREVGYLDSAGIHLIHHLREDLRAGGQKLVLVIPDGSPINATLRLAGLDWREQTVQSPDDAKHAIQSAGQPEAGGCCRS